MNQFRTHPSLRRLLALMLSLAMALSLPAGVASAADSAAADPNVLEASTLDAFDKGVKKDGDSTAAGAFTLLWSEKSKVDSSNKTWDDGYTSSQRINFGGSTSLEKNAIRFDTAGDATVKVWWAAGEKDRQIGILDSSGATVAVTEVESTKNSPYCSELALSGAGTYYLGGSSGNSYIFKVEVTTGAAEKPPRADWSTVSAPVITSVESGEEITLTVNALVGYDGADKLNVTVTDADGKAVTVLSSGRMQEQHTLTYAPTASGTYHFSAALSRAEEEDIVGAETKSCDYVLPLGIPGIKYVANVGGGSLAAEWEPVPEADGYLVTVKDTDYRQTVTGTTATIEGLTVGQSYTVMVAALRGEETGSAGSTKVSVSGEAETIWAFSAFGTGVDLTKNGSEGRANDGEVRVYSTGGKGKLVPASTDGLAFYYTKIPTERNFRLSATANVNTWTYSNGQEGFGLMAADAVGSNGDSATFWNNSYMASVTKVEYTAGEGKYSMKLGVGSQEKVGVEASNINAAKQLDDMSVYSSQMRTLETGCADAGLPGGTYNLVDKATASVPGTVDKPLSSFLLTVERNNTGYFVSYTDPDGVTHTNKYYDTAALDHLDPDNVYVGFFASRYADITFTDISLSTSDPANDAPAEERPVTYVEPSYQVESAAIANQSRYELVFYGNADGTLAVQDADGNTLFSGAVTAGTKANVPLSLNRGNNVFTLTMTPDPDFRPSEYERLRSYEPVQLSHSVTYAVNSASTVYVAPDGTDDAAGTQDAPQSITAAVAKAIPGQTIVLQEGRYALTNRLVIERGINGTARKPITLTAAPDAASRPVLDFGQNSAGLIVAGDYWHLYGFDVTNSKNGEKGIQVSGSHNTLELLETYKNGNTGIQLSRYKSSDARSDWPQDNLILNCTSYLNADAGYEDADGFAAKLTIGEGNVFDGCIAHHNADDGWDLYAKVETGSIGKVVIRNSVAYKNGYILDAEGKEINAGNGNGFKMGGESLPGGHTLINSVAFANKAKGIDSNSCPDIKAYRSTSFDNESYNVAFYTNTAVNTDFAAEGILSFKTSNTVEDNFKLLGTQDESKVYGDSNYYLKGGRFANAAGEEVQESWFLSTDTAAAINGGVTRKSDGSIDMGDYLKRSEAAPALVGADLDNPERPAPAESSGSSSSSSSNVTTSVTDDGTVVRTKTAADGTVTVNEARTDGSTLKTVTAPDGSSVITGKGADGTTANVTTDASGAVRAASATVSAQAIKTALAADAPVVLPVTLPLASASVTLSVTLPAFTGNPADVAHLPEIELPLTKTGAGVVAMTKAADGRLEPIKECRTGSLIVPLAESCELVITDNSKQFPDVRAGEWYADSVSFVTAREIFNGTGSAFEPDAPMTRAMVAQVLYNYDRSNAPGSTASFADVSDDAWFSSAVGWAAENGIVNGYAPGEFAPQRNVSRQDFVTLLYRYAARVGYDVSASADLSGYSDAADVADYADAAFRWAVSKGIIIGLDGSLAPNDSATRAQIATMFQRFVQTAR